MISVSFTIRSYNLSIREILTEYIFLAAGHATESFTDFVVGHGELWSAQMLSFVIRKVVRLFMAFIIFVFLIFLCAYVLLKFSSTTEWGGL